MNRVIELDEEHDKLSNDLHQTKINRSKRDRLMTEDTNERHISSPVRLERSDNNINLSEYSFQKESQNSQIKVSLLGSSLKAINLFKKGISNKISETSNKDLSEKEGSQSQSSK